MLLNRIFFYPVLNATGHDSSLHIANLAAGKEPVVQSVRLASLPLSSLLFLSENSIVGGGHDFNPAIFINKSGKCAHLYGVDRSLFRH